MVVNKFLLDDGSVESLIWKNLNFCCYDNALFLAEQLYAQEKTESSTYLLAACFHRSNRPNQAKKLLQCSSLTQPMSRYLYAQCCLETGDLVAAEDALIGARTGSVAAAAAAAAAAASTAPQQSQSPCGDDLARLCQDFGGGGVDDPAAVGFALKLLGDVYRRTDRCERAAECYRRALAACPSLWVCYQALCSLGEAPDPADAFPAPVTDASLSPMSATTATAASAASSDGGRQQQQQASLDSSASVMSAGSGGGGCASRRASLATGMSPLTKFLTTPATPDSAAAAAEAAAAAAAPSRRRPKSGRFVQPPAGDSGGGHWLRGVVPPQLPPTPIPQHQQQQPPATGGDSTASDAASAIGWDAFSTPVLQLSGASTVASAAAAVPPPLLTTTPSSVAAGHPRAGVVLGSAMSPLGAKENNQGVRTRAQTRSLAHSARAGNTARRSRSIRNKDSASADEELAADKRQQQHEKMQDDSAASDQQQQLLQLQLQEHQLAQQQQRSAWLAPLLRQLGAAYRLLSVCKWQEAARQLESLPPKLHYSGPALHWLSRAYYELEDYHRACCLFEELRRRQPWSLRGMDIYSSTLWYLQKEAALSGLARELLELDRCTAAEPWCVAGNCFSLQKEHEVALKYFRRATQINPQHAYAFVLLALEYTSVDQLDKALAAFRTAVRLEPRAYNAWYGISNVYFKQEKFALAECHFHKALRIYPNSAVLLTNFGVTKARMGRLSDALDFFTQAKRLSPKMPLCRYQRASVLFSLERHQDALDELNSLRQLTPRESRVYFLLGRVHKAMGEDHQAMVFFNWAMDLDPRGANLQLNDTLDLMTPVGGSGSGAGGGGGGGAASESDTTMEQQMQHQQQLHGAPAMNSLEDSLSDQSSDEYDYDVAQYT